MNRRRRVLILLFCSLLTVSAVAQTTSPAPADVAEVSVLVMEASNRAVTGLGIRDFRVLEDEVPQAVTSVKENKLAGDYTVSYAPKNPAKDGAWRKVRVEIVGFLGPRLTIHHSAGYSATPAAR